MIRTIQILTMVVFSIMPSMLLAEAPLSDATQECLDCHASIHPGMVEDWKKSRHAVIHPEKAMAAEEIAKKEWHGNGKVKTVTLWERIRKGGIEIKTVWTVDLSFQIPEGESLIAVVLDADTGEILEGKQSESH